MATINDFVNNLFKKKDTRQTNVSNTLNLAQSIGQGNLKNTSLQNNNGATTPIQTKITPAKNTPNSSPTDYKNLGQIQSTLHKTSVKPQVNQSPVQSPTQLPTPSYTPSISPTKPTVSRETFVDSLAGRQPQAQKDPYLQYLDSLFDAEKLSQVQKNIDTLAERTANTLRRGEGQIEDLEANRQGQLSFGQRADILDVTGRTNKQLADLATAQQGQQDIFDRMLGAGKQAYELRQGGDNELLSISDAQDLGVPYGTTVGQAKGLGITPGTLGGGGAEASASGWAQAVQSGSAKLSDVPLDIRESAGFINAFNQPSTEQSEQARIYETKISDIDNLISNEGLSPATGVFATGRNPLNPKKIAAKQEFLGEIGQLISELSLESLVEAKDRGATFGALSDTELQILSNAASPLAQWVKKGRDGRITGIQVSEQTLKDTLEDIKREYKYAVDKDRTRRGLPTLDEIQALKDSGFTESDIAEYEAGLSSVGNTSASLNVPQRNNNPGNIKRGGLADSLAVGVDNQGHLIFPDQQTGFRAMALDIQSKVSGNSRYLPANPTLAQLGSVYAEDPNWANSVAKILNVSPSTRTQTIPINQLTQAIARQEGFFA